MEWRLHCLGALIVSVRLSTARTLTLDPARMQVLPPHDPHPTGLLLLLKLADVKRFILAAICAAVIAGCGTVRLEVSPSAVPHYPVAQKTDVNGVLTWAILPPSYNPRLPTPRVIYNHGYGQTIASIAADAPQSPFVMSLVAAGFVVVASEYRDLACWGNSQCVEECESDALEIAAEPLVETLCDRREHGRHRHLECDRSRYSQASGCCRNLACL